MKPERVARLLPPVLVCIALVVAPGRRADGEEHTSGEDTAVEETTVEDTAIDCGTPFTSDSGDTGSSGAGQDHGSPENDPYDIADFDTPESCAVCHPQHYDEWQGSIHAYSATNPVMWAGSKRIGELTDFPLNCVGCHAPIYTLTAPGPQPVLYSADQLPEAARGGVTCISCHKLYDVYNGVNQFTQCADYYFGTIPDPIEHGYHTSDYSPIHAEALVCRSCHNVENLNDLQVEFTYTEWLDANQAAGGTEFEPAIQTCQDCHMPARTGPAALGGPDRTVHGHSFVGGDVALTPFADSHRQFGAVSDLMRTAGAVDVQPRYTSGLLTDVELAVTNLNEGHDLPSGAAFDRQVWLEIFATDGTGNILIETGTLDANGDLRDAHSEFEPNTDPPLAQGMTIFRSYLYDINGEETFNFIDEAITIEDFSIEAGQTRYVQLKLMPEPTAATALPITIQVRLLYRPYPPHVLRALGLAAKIIDAVPIFEIDSAVLVLDSAEE